MNCPACWNEMVSKNKVNICDKCNKIYNNEMVEINQKGEVLDEDSDSD